MCSHDRENGEAEEPKTSVPRPELVRLEELARRGDEVWFEPDGQFDRLRRRCLKP